MSKKKPVTDPMTPAQAGKLGGQATRRRKPSHFASAGAKGGKVTAERYGPEYYSEIGKKGGARMKQYAEIAKAQLADSAE